MEVEKFFEYICHKVERAYSASDVRMLNRNWSWSICALPLRVNHDLILGLNWGGDGTFNPQDELPTSKDAVEEIRTYSFIKRTSDLLYEYGFDLDNINYLNISPFRTPKVHQLSIRDWNLSLNEFFVDMIDFLSPNRTLLLGTSGVTTLKSICINGDLSLIDKLQEYKVVNGKTTTGYQGVIRGKVGEHRFFAVPHPCARISSQTRQAIWSEVFS